MRGGQLVQRRQLDPARRAPGRPDVEQYERAALFFRFRARFHLRQNVAQRRVRFRRGKAHGQGAGRSRRPRRLGILGRLCGSTRRHGSRRVFCRCPRRAAIRGAFSGLAARFAEHFIERFRQLSGTNLVVIDVDQFALGRDQVNEAAVIDVVVRSRRRLIDLLAVQPVAERCAELVGQRAQILHLAAQALDTFMEMVGINLEIVHIVTDRIDGDEERLNSVRILDGAHHFAVFVQRRRADVRTVGVTDRQQQVFARVALLRDAPFLADQVEMERHSARRTRGEKVGGQAKQKKQAQQPPETGKQQTPG